MLIDRHVLVVVSAALLMLLAQGAPAGNTGVLGEAEFAKLHSLKTEEAPAARGVVVDLADGSKAYLTLPEQWQPGGTAVLVIHEWWGLNSHIKHWADRFTASGRAALAVDLYGGKVAATREEAGAAMRAVDQAKAVKTLLAGHAFLSDDARVKASKRASIGWCFGGGMSLQLALHAPDLDAAVMYYGKPVTDAAELKKIKAPLLGVFGERDKAFPPALIEQFKGGLREAGVAGEVLLFPADHAFANPSGGNYDAVQAAAAWTKVQAFLESKLPVAK
ncbi:MAG: dienelactone hydrolase family protein [Planctomycetes bacterium]|nr:dienelactone hydrolase family protein [Planctomycetota bacterium]